MRERSLHVKFIYSSNVKLLHRQIRPISQHNYCRRTIIADD